MRALNKIVSLKAVDANEKGGVLRGKSGTRFSAETQRQSTNSEKMGCNFSSLDVP